MLRRLVQPPEHAQQHPLQVPQPCAFFIGLIGDDVPALAVDNEGNRLGYGGGFYDRFLKDIKSPKIVPISKSLVFDNIPTEDFDIKIDMIITD